MLHSRAAHWLLAGLTLGLLSLVAWAGGAWPQELWGLGFGGVLGQGTRAGLLVGAIALLACAAAGWLERPGRILGRWLERRPWLGYGTLLVALLLALLALHSHQAWYGAGNAVNDLERQYTTNLFSCLYLQTLARSIGSLAFVEPLQHPRDPIVALVSLASALPWFLVLVGLAQRSDPDRRAPHLALLLAAPALALFAGHREIYFVPVLMLALYAWVASTEIERARLPWLSGLVAGLAVSAHMLNAALLPSLLPLALGRERLGARSVSRAAVLGLGFLLGFGGPLAYRWHFGWHGVIPDDPFVVWGSFAHLQPGENGLLWAWESHPHKGFWSAEHLPGSLPAAAAPSVGFTHPPGQAPASLPAGPVAGQPRRVHRGSTLRRPLPAVVPQRRLRPLLGPAPGGPAAAQARHGRARGGGTAGVDRPPGPQPAAGGRPGPGPAALRARAGLR
jgi:hypothetical protein